MRLLISFIGLLFLNSCAISVPIVDKPIVFKQKRLKLTQDYLENRYGMSQDNILIKPQMIVVHWTAIPTLEKSFDSYQPYAGEIVNFRNGVFIAKENGKTMAYSLFNLSERARMIVEPATEVYEGMIVGLNSRSFDLVVNPCKNKNLTNVRSSGTDEALKLLDPLKFTLEEALEFINHDELVEITPDAIRLRKKILDERVRRRANKGILKTQKKQENLK